MNEKELARFVSKYSINAESGCWEWFGNLSCAGYGVVFRIVDGKEVNKRAHRVSYEHHKGEIPKGLLVRHMCNNRKCVNPDHLELGTNEDNTRDRQESGRTASGSNHYLHKRDIELIEAIRVLRRNSVTIADICKKLDIGRSTYFRAMRADPELRRYSERARAVNSSVQNARRVLECPESYARGEQLGQAKLTDDQVREIRFMRESGMLLREIAEKFEMSEINISNIARRKIWKHVS